MRTVERAHLSRRDSVGARVPRFPMTARRRLDRLEERVDKLEESRRHNLVFRLLWSGPVILAALYVRAGKR